MATPRKKVSSKQIKTNQNDSSKTNRPGQGHDEHIHAEHNQTERGVAVVSGGAGSIGAVICGALAREGMRVVVGYNRSAEKAKALAASLPGGDHAAFAAPVTDSAGLAALAAEISGRYGCCDVLVNCAGVTRFVPHSDLDALDDTLIDNILSTNVRGPFAAVRALRPLLEKSKQPGGAVVINISSIAGVLAPKIRVVSVSPGLVANDFVRSMDKTWLDEQVNRTPLKRLAAPEEAASAVIAAIKHLTFTTGSIIPVDGGRPLS